MGNEAPDPFSTLSLSDSLLSTSSVTQQHPDTHVLSGSRHQKFSQETLLFCAKSKSFAVLHEPNIEQADIQKNSFVTAPRLQPDNLLPDTMSSQMKALLASLRS
jgi:hypothetical protein